MKRLTIGRGNDCDIVIPDETDDVSRHHLVLSFNFWGKMTVSDTSSNGTYINNNRMLKGTSLPVTLNDVIRLGNKWQFDWSLVKDPYKGLRRMLLSLVCLLLLAGIGGGIWYVLDKNKEKTEEPIVIPIETDSKDSMEWNGDSTKKVAPTVLSITPQNTVKTKTVRKKKAKKDVYTIKKQSIPKENVNSKNESSEKDVPLVIN